MQIPPEFDAAFYKSTYGLDDKSDEYATANFYNSGVKSGKCGSPLCQRKEFLEYLRAKFGRKKILEIGPGFDPAFKGYNVKYFDIYDADGLRDWATCLKKPVHGVPVEIHYVEPLGDLSIIDEKFDLIFSSHNIEHTVDLIKYLNNIRWLLKDDGIFACIAPDRRYTFDYFKPESTFEEIVDQHFCRASNMHPVQSWISSLARAAHNDCIRHWAGDHGHTRGGDWAHFHASMEGYLRKQTVDGSHRWIFTADSFRSVMADLAERGFISLELESLYNVPLNMNSFNAIFVPKEPTMINGTPTLSQKPCNICGYTEYRTGPKGRFGLNGALPECMLCHSLERHRAGRLAWDRLRPWLASIKALQISADTAVPANWFRNFEVSVYGGENHLDLQDIARPDGAYDMVICNHVLEHVADDNRAMNELLRIIRHDGILQITVPMLEDGNTKDWGFADPKLLGHYRVYGRDLWSRFKASFYLLEVQTRDPVTERPDTLFFLTHELSRCRFLYSTFKAHFPVQWRYMANGEPKECAAINALNAVMREIVGRDDFKFLRDTAEGRKKY